MEQEKQVVFFSDLIYAILYRWKVMIAAILIFALALGGFQLYRNSKAGDTTASADAAASVVHGENRITTIKENISSQEEYMDNSILMTMDPYNVSRITTEFYVDTDYQIMPGMDYQNIDKTPAVLRAYKLLLTTQDALDTFSKETGLEQKYISELIITEVVANSNILSITVRCPDADSAAKLTDAIIAYLGSAKEDITQQIVAHNTAVFTSKWASPVDADLAKLQDDAAQRLTNLRESLDKAETELRILKNNASGVKTATPVVMAVLGAFAGAMLVALWAVVYHLASSKIYSARVLGNRTGIRILGALPGTGKFRFLRKLEGRTVDANEDVLAINIRNYCGENTKLLCLGDWAEEHTETLGNALREAGIEAAFAGSLLTDAQALKSLPAYSNVLLLSTCGKTTYPQTEKEMQLIADQGKQLLGCVLLGG